MNDRNITNALIIQVNQLLQIDSHLTAKQYVDNVIEESSMVRTNQDNDFNTHNLTNITSITLNTEAVIDNRVITKAYVDQFHNDNERSRRDLGFGVFDESTDLVKNNQDNDLSDKKLMNLDGVTVNRDPKSDNELSLKKYIDNELDENTILGFNQTIQNYLKVSVGNDVYNRTKYDKIQFIDTSEIKFPNTGANLLQKRKTKCNDRNNNGNIHKFVRSSKTSSPTYQTGATPLPLIGVSFMYIETSSNNHRANVFVVLKELIIIKLLT